MNSLPLTPARLAYWAVTWQAVQTHGQAIILNNGTDDSPEYGWQCLTGADWKIDCLAGNLRFMRHTANGGGFLSIGFAFSAGGLPYAPDGLAVGASALIGAERMRVSGGSAAVAGSTDVVFGDGQISAGGAIRTRTGMFSGDSTGITVAAAATWTDICPSFGGLLILRDGTSGGVCALMHDVNVSSVTVLANSIGGTLTFQVSGGNLQVQIATGTFPRILRTVRLVAAEF
jgi:hypothetical protein